MATCGLKSTKKKPIIVTKARLLISLDLLIRVLFDKRPDRDGGYLPLNIGQMSAFYRTLFEQSIKINRMRRKYP